MNDLQTEYCGFKIDYLETSNKWRIADDGEHGVKEKDTLAECKAWIDKIGKQETKEKFKRQPAILFRYREAKKVTVTSFAGQNYTRSEYWITDAEGKRSKESGLKIYDEESAAKLQSLINEKERLEVEISGFHEAMPAFTYKGEVAGRG